MHTNEFIIFRISIITPVFNGRKHLINLSRIINEAADAVRLHAEIEWVISNDDPSDPIKETDISCSDQINIYILQTDTNRGIQGARVTGLNAASGDYVLFLDQDDYIAPEYFMSQLEHIGDADAVVCDCTYGGKPMYDVKSSASLDESITKQYNLTKHCGFLPGQVLIRRSSIPDIWKNNWLKWNCCDDYFLWLCMFSKGCRFVANEDCLYDHTVTGKNQGINRYAWYMSTMEMMDIVHREKLFSEAEEETLSRARNEEIALTLNDKEWTQRKLVIYQKLISVYERNLSISKVLNDLGVEKTAIYGAEHGIRLYERLKSEGQDVVCFIDKGAGKWSLPIPAYTQEMIPREVDCVINMLIRDESSVNDYISLTYPDIKVIHVQDLLDKVLASDVNEV